MFFLLLWIVIGSVVKYKKKEKTVKCSFFNQSKRIFFFCYNSSIITLKFIEPFNFLIYDLVCIFLLFYIAIIRIAHELTRDIKGWRTRGRKQKDIFYKYLEKNVMLLLFSTFDLKILK